MGQNEIAICSFTKAQKTHIFIQIFINSTGLAFMRRCKYPMQLTQSSVFFVLEQVSLHRRNFISSSGELKKNASAPFFFSLVISFSTNFLFTVFVASEVLFQLKHIQLIFFLKLSLRPPTFPLVYSSKQNLLFTISSFAYVHSPVIRRRSNIIRETEKLLYTCRN